VCRAWKSRRNCSKRPCRIASRIADQAIVGEVLVNEAIVSTVAGRTFEPAGRRSLKGFSEPVRLWSLTR
jgi:class 3 adenylate cyclase